MSLDSQAPISSLKKLLLYWLLAWSLQSCLTIDQEIDNLGKVDKQTQELRDQRRKQQDMKEAKHNQEMKKFKEWHYWDFYVITIESSSDLYARGKMNGQDVRVLGRHELWKQKIPEQVILQIYE